MKVYIGPPKPWFGPYQLAEVLCFWAKDTYDKHGLPSKPEWVHKFGEWLAYGSVEPEPKIGELRPWKESRKKTLLYKFLTWINTKKARDIKVRIDDYDVWDMRSSIAYIILPTLLKLKASKRGAPNVADIDVPELLRSTNALYKKTEEDVDTNHFKRWDWVIDEMIFSFDAMVNPKDEEFHQGEADYVSIKKVTDTGDVVYHMGVGPNHTLVYDAEGYENYAKRVTNGLRLFGKYYEALWD